MKCYQQENGLVVVQSDDGKDLMGFPACRLIEAIDDPMAAASETIDEIILDGGEERDYQTQSLACFLVACMWYSERYNQRLTATCHL